MKKILSLLFIGWVYCTTAVGAKSGTTTGNEDRTVWLNTMLKIANPVLTNGSNCTLKQNMPYESLGDRKEFSYLEALGRTICGVAPWLELGPDDTPEGKLRQHYLVLAVNSITHAVNPNSPDYMVFDKPYQPLVDAAFLAQGLLRSPTQLWANLPQQTKKNVIAALKLSRAIRPFESNWLLFASMVEAALLEFNNEYDADRLFYGVKKFRDDWYKGDAHYGDGPAYHADYYNSFVIHPMLTDIMRILDKHNMDDDGFYRLQQVRLSRYAEQQERMISPEGTYPVLGRSIVYRTGVFHALGQAALLGLLPTTVEPAQVRCALTEVIKRQYESPDNFDEAGWLRVGFNGSQIDMSEAYINTGSLYLCLSGFLPLGLKADNAFWVAPAADWTTRKAWGGEPVKADAATRQ